MKLIFLALLIFLGGCASDTKHETTSLQCLGLCAFTNINHESTTTTKEQSK